jgi:hypothetical protein
MRLYGQTFTSEVLERIRSAVAADSALSRSALSRRVCGWLGWHDAAGEPKEVSSRKALVELQRRGLIELLVARCAAPQAREAVALEPFAGPVFSGSLEALGGVELVAVYVSPLQPDWRRVLCQRPAPVLCLPLPAAIAPSVDAGDDPGWVEQEFGRVDFPDARLRTRLLSLAAAFAAQPTAPIPVALQGNASQTKAAYRFFNTRLVPATVRASRASVCDDRC